MNRKTIILAALLCNCATAFAQKPEPKNDTLVIQTAQPQLHNILMNDYISREYNPTAFTITAPPKGKAEIKAERGVSKLFYTPLPDNFDDDELTYQICDNKGQCAQAKVFIIRCMPTRSAYPKVDQPLLHPTETKQYTYPDQIIRISKQPQHGNLALSPDSTTLTYTPTAGYTGEDRYNFDVYRFKKQCGYTYQEGINAFVQLVPTDADNKPPIAQTDEVTIVGTRKTEIPVLDNDSDPEGNLRKKIDKVTPGKGGKVKYSSTAITYTPNPNFSGTDTLTYEVCDYNGACTTGKVVVTVKRK